MSWRYRSYSYKSKFYFSETEIDFTTEYLNYHQFLLQEFFTADKETGQKIATYYIAEYGSRSFSYLKNKYAEWKNGNYHLTDMMKERILYLMPKFLNEKAKHKLGIHDFMATIKKNVSGHLSNRKSSYKTSLSLKKPQEVIDIFEKEFSKIKSLTNGPFRFNVLSEEEKQEALEVSQYILETKLQIDFDQIERDFNIFLPYMQRFNRGKFSASYYINSFNLKVDIANSGISDLVLPKFQIKDLAANSNFKVYADKYLAYELSLLHTERNRAVANAFLNQNDIKLFFDHYDELAFGDSEIKMKSNFQSEAGTLHLEINMKPLKMLRTALTIDIFKVFVYFVIAIALIVFAINSGLWGWLLFGGLVFGVATYTFIIEQIQNIKTLTTEIKRYGK